MTLRSQKSAMDIASKEGILDFGKLHESIVPTKISWLAGLDVDLKPKSIRKTSIICTIGPKINNVKALTDLMKEGMNIARLNFSHGTHEFHASTVKNIRDCFKSYNGRPVAIALDTKGPEIRSGNLKDENGLLFNQGDEFIITTDDAFKDAGDKSKIYFVDYKNLCSAVKPGGKIYVDDGIFCLIVVEVRQNEIKVRANNTHKLLSHKGVNLPGARVDLPAISDKDVEDLKFAVDHQLDMIFASFIRKADDVRHIRKVLGEKGADIRIISKIESQEGIKNFDEILLESDGIMVARGDLGIEIEPEKVFVAQKMMIAKCNIAGKTAICATQMLESMVQNPRPTRAEVSDVSNAVLDGSDCVMLSAETARGTYPLEAVNFMHRLCLEAESTISYVPLFEELRLLTFKSAGPSETIACAAVSASFEKYIEAIVVLSRSGDTARYVSKFRPEVPIVVVTRSEAVARKIHLHRGCYPLVYPNPSNDDVRDWQADVDSRIKYAIKKGKEMDLIKGGHIIAIQGWQGGKGLSNTMRILPVD